MIVAESGGTAWWIPFGTALAVALVAAAASYYATWRFKRADVNRESAFRTADLVDQAERLASWRGDEGEDNGGADLQEVTRLLQRARVWAQPLDDSELDDRMRAGLALCFEMAPTPPGRSWHWLRESIANVRAGLVPHLSAPKLVRRRRPAERSFPTSDELNAMPSDGGTDDFIDALVDWRNKRTDQPQ
jgi:hypothetical protein